MFALIGGLSANGGTLSIVQVQTGCSHRPMPCLDGSFESYLGDLFPILKQKWIQWLAMAYSK